MEHQLPGIPLALRVVAPEAGEGTALEKHRGARDLVRALEKDRMFYEQSGGGVTLSRGGGFAPDMGYGVSA